MRFVLPGVSWKSYLCFFTAHHNSCFCCSDKSGSISGSVLSGLLGQVESSSPVTFSSVASSTTSQAAVRDSHQASIFTWKMRFFFRFSGIIIAYVTSVILLWMVYGPCHSANNLSFYAGSNTSTCSPTSKDRCLAFRSYHTLAFVFAFVSITPASCCTCFSLSCTRCTYVTTLTGVISLAYHVSLRMSNGPLTFLPYSISKGLKSVVSVGTSR